jgi:subtilisin family serine protease
MKIKLYFMIILLTIISLSLGLMGLGSLTLEAAGNPKRVIVILEDGVAVNAKATSALENLGGKVLKELPLVKGLVVLLPGEAAAKDIGAMVGVKKVEEDVKVFALGKPSGKPGKGGGGKNGEQPPEVLEWGVDRIDADLAWTTSTGSGVKVAIIDTGIDKNHADLVGNLKGGVNFVSKGRKAVDVNKWDDDNGHGTHVAGIVAAVDNEIGVIGVAPEANLWAIKALDRNGSGYISDVIAGIDWSIDNGMDVINMSLGTSSDIQALHDAVDAAYGAGIVLVAAAGNSGDGDGITSEVVYPAKYNSVIAVAATAFDDSTPTWSAEGAEVELAAPGVNIRSTWKDGGYNTISGTSMAAPHVAGAVALALSVADLSPSEVRANLQASADDMGSVGFDNFYGYGLVDAEESTTGTETQ